MKKTTQNIITISALIVVTVVVLALAFRPFFTGLKEEATEPDTCQYTLVLSGIVEELPTACQAKTVTIDPGYLKDRRRLAQANKAIADYQTEPGTLKNWYEPDDDNAPYRWILAQTVADELATCAQKTRGPLVRLAREKILRIGVGDATCIVCSHITVTQEAKPLIKGGYNLNTWLERHTYEPLPAKARHKPPEPYKTVITNTFGLEGFTPAAKETYAQLFFTMLEPNIQDALTTNQPLAITSVHVPIGAQVSDVWWTGAFPSKDLLTKPVITFSSETLLGVEYDHSPRCDPTKLIG